MKEWLEKLIKDKQKRADQLRNLIREAETADEVRTLGDELTAVEDEIRSAKAQLEQLESTPVIEPGAEPQNEPRNAANAGTNVFNPMAMVATAQMNGQRSNSEDPRGTMEYRQAFMAYIQRGEINREVLRFETRADAFGTSTDLGVLIPTTVMQQIITELSGVYGQLYSRVRKTNVQGGVKYPI